MRGSEDIKLIRFITEKNVVNVLAMEVNSTLDSLYDAVAPDSIIHHMQIIHMNIPYHPSTIPSRLENSKYIQQIMYQEHGHFRRVQYA